MKKICQKKSFLGFSWIFNRNKLTQVLLIFCAISFMGCQKALETKTQSLASEIPNTLCEGTSNKTIFQVMNEVNDRQNENGTVLVPDAKTKSQVTDDLKDLLIQHIEKKSNSNDEDAKLLLAEKTAELIQLLDQDVRSLDDDDFETKMARLEDGSRITEEYEKYSSQAQTLLTEVKTLSKSVGLACETDQNLEDNQSAPSNGVPPENNYKTPNHLSQGLRWTMATGYQTCESLKSKPVDKMVETVQGIKKNSETGGRSYSSIPSIIRTHYYYKGMSYGQSCVDVSKKPLVYDFAGVAELKNNQLNMFVNKGGGSALGIDCSAYASAAAATAGLLYKKNQTGSVYKRYTTRDFVNPTAANWDCYSKVAVNPQTSILPGDLVIFPGHMVGVDSIEKDPFGIAGTTNISQCDNLNPAQFRFAIIQSSASKGSMGLNRYDAAAYSAETSEIKKLFLAYAKASCQAKFNGKTISPTLPSSKMNIIRHSGKPECKAERVPLVNESCIASCQESFNF